MSTYYKRIKRANGIVIDPDWQPIATRSPEDIMSGNPNVFLVPGTENRLSEADLQGLKVETATIGQDQKNARWANHGAGAYQVQKAGVDINKPGTKFYFLATAEGAPVFSAGPGLSHFVYYVFKTHEAAQSKIQQMQINNQYWLNVLRK